MILRLYLGKLVIQHEGQEFCPLNKSSRLGTDTKGVLAELGVHLAQRFLPGS
jgi:hypothetical protein